MLHINLSQSSDLATRERININLVLTFDRLRVSQKCQFTVKQLTNAFTELDIFDISFLDLLNNAMH